MKILVNNNVRKILRRQPEMDRSGLEPGRTIDFKIPTHICLVTTSMILIRTWFKSEFIHDIFQDKMVLFGLELILVGVNVAYSVNTPFTVSSK